MMGGMKPSRTQTRLICPLTADSLEAMRADMFLAAASGAEMVECRLDFLPALPDSEQLRDLLTDAPLPVIVTCRPKRQGGRFGDGKGSEKARLALLRRASEFESVAAVDVELDTPPEQRPSKKVILSHHDFEGCPDNLDELAETIDRSDAPVNKIAFTARSCAEALRAFDVIRDSAKPMLGLAMGEAGLISRILAKKFGGFGTFGSLGSGRESAPGQPSLADIKKLYRWDDIDSDTAVFGVIGCPVAHSLSPAIHNAAFAATDQNAVYLPLRIEPGDENFRRFMDAVRARPWLHLRGLSVTIPHKQNALAYVGAKNCDELGVRIGAINTIRIDSAGQPHGWNTDYGGAIDALVNAMSITRVDLKGRSVAVLGAGGAGRAIVAALVHYGAEVVIYNRTLKKAEKLAEEFNSCAAPLSDAPTSEAEILINCTSIGMHPKVDDCPLETIPAGVIVVFDTVYNPLQTRLLRLAEASGVLTVTGLEMFLNQAVAQFKIWTSQKAHRDVMREVVINKLTSGE